MKMGQPRSAQHERAQPVGFACCGGGGGGRGAGGAPRPSPFLTPRLNKTTTIIIFFFFFFFCRSLDDRQTYMSVPVEICMWEPTVRDHSSIGLILDEDEVIRKVDGDYWNQHGDPWRLVIAME